MSRGASSPSSCTGVRVARWPSTTSAARPRSSPAPRPASAARRRGRSRLQAFASRAARAASTGSRPRSRSSSTSPIPRAPRASSRPRSSSSAASTSSSTTPGSRSAAYPFDESNEEDEAAMFETNVNGLVRMTRLCLPHIRAGGHIVNMGSVAGRQAYENGATYVASKFAVRGFTYALREDLLGRPIRITTVDAGLVETEFSLVRFKGDAEQAAAVYKGIDPLTAGGHRGLRPVGADAAVAHERRRDRRQGAQPVVGRPDLPRDMTAVARRHRDADPAGRARLPRGAARRGPRAGRPADDPRHRRPLRRLRPRRDARRAAAASSTSSCLRGARRSRRCSRRCGRISSSAWAFRGRSPPMRSRCRGSAGSTATRRCCHTTAGRCRSRGRSARARRSSASRSTAWTRSSTPARSSRRRRCLSASSASPTSSTGAWARP